MPDDDLIFSVTVPDARGLRRRQDSRGWFRLKITANAELDEQPVEFGFKRSLEIDETWVDAEWEDTAALVRYARVMVGPTGTGANSVGVFEAGLYRTAVRIDAPPEHEAERGPSFFVDNCGLTATFPFEAPVLDDLVTELVEETV